MPIIPIHSAKRHLVERNSVMRAQPPAGTDGWGFEGFAAARWLARPPIRTTPRNERSAHD